MITTRLLGLFLLLTGVASAADNLQDRLKAAKAGQTVTLPAGEFRGGVTLPAGVSLKGAGYGKTIINASDAESGITIEGGDKAGISDLTVRGARGANILVRGASNVTIRQVRVTGALIGVNVADGKQCRVENVIADANRYGIIVTGGEDNTVVNCTMVDNAALSLSLPSGKRATAFNNVATGSPLAVYVGDGMSDTALDHNLYTGMNIGKLGHQLGRETLNSWRHVSGWDAHSVNFPVAFDQNFAVTNVLDWAQDRPVTAGWGAKFLSGQKAPGDYLGAVDSTVTAPRPADGTLTVTTGSGLTSAGVFDGNGKLVKYLFQALPLRAGKYPFWLPSRSYKGQAIAAGEYEVRVLESRLEWKSLGWIGNSSTSSVPGSWAAGEVGAICFSDTGQLVVGRGWSEEHGNIRGFDSATGQWQWTFKGSSGMCGLTTASDGLVYALRPDGTKQARVTRIDPKTGNVVPWGATDYGSFLLQEGSHLYNGIAALRDHLFYTDPTSNVVRIGTIQSPEPTRSVAVSAPSSPAADAKANVVWVISGGDKIVAVAIDGKVVAESSVVPKPFALAARAGRLAVASEQTGKVHLFDSLDPKNLKQVSTLGRGDGPDGLVLPDRFLFQQGAMPVNLAFGPKGELAVGERAARIQVFDREGKVIWSTYCSGGWSTVASKVTPGRLFAGGYTLLLDGEKKSWRPESFHRALQGGEMVGDFVVNGQTFVAFNTYGHATGVFFVKFTPEKCETANGILWPYPTRQPWSYRVDNNGDRVVNTNDAVVATLNDANNQPVANRKVFDRYNELWPNGDLTSASVDGWLTRWPCAGLDEKGHPIYRFLDRVPLPSDKSDLVSPYDHRPVAPGGRPGTTDHEPRMGGGWVMNSGCSGNPTKSLLNNGGVDLIGVDKNGGVDWVVPFGAFPRIGSLKTGDGLYIAGMGQSYDCFVVNDDGLLMPGFGFAADQDFKGHWVDHTDTLSVFVDKAGKVNVVFCDYVQNRNPWLRLEKKEVHASKTKLQVTPEIAARLAALPVKMLDVAAGKPATPTVRIAKLNAPLTIDGSLQKWRDAGVQPIIITPESSSGIEGGAPDCSTIVRLAYHGQDLYMQALRFDDIVTTHQPRGRAYLQDTVEMAVNGTMEGIKHNISLTSDSGPVNQVDGWDLLAHTLDKNDSPLVIQILDNAESVTERKLIESIFGVDMRHCKVQVFETKIPMDAKTYAKRENAIFELKTGAQFWLGFLIDDNDQPGTDLQNYLIWPVTYSTFNPKESGAIAILE